MKLHSIKNNQLLLDKSYLKWGGIFCVISVFTRALTSIRVFGIDYDLLSYTFFLISFLVVISLFKLNKKFTFFLFIFSFINLFATLFVNYPLFPLLKTLLPLVLILFTVYHILSKINIIDIFRFYVNCTFYTAIFGIIQFSFKLFFGIKLLSNYSSIDLHSVAAEPSHYTAILLPALIYTTIQFKQNKVKFFILFIAMVLTLKITSFFTFALAITIAYFNIGYLLLFGTLFLLIYSNFIITNPEYAFRILPLLDYFSGGNVFSKALSGTPLSFLSNLEVAFFSLKKNLINGVGIGNHETAYFEKYSLANFIGAERSFGLNARSGHALTIRIISELGLLGILGYTYFFIKNIILSKKFTVYHAISIGCLSHFIAKSLKLGAYIDYGTPFFFCVFLINHQQYRKMKKSLNN